MSDQARARTLTEHAIERYQRRVDPLASREDVQTALDAGRWQWGAPGWLSIAGLLPNGVVVGPGYAFLMRANEQKLVATTCIGKRRIPKADRRAHRELERDRLGYA